MYSNKLLHSYILCTSCTTCMLLGVTTQQRLHWAQPWSLGEKKTIFKLVTTTLYVLSASCTTCVIDPRFPELKCGDPRGPRGPMMSELRG